MNIYAVRWAFAIPDIHPTDRMVLLTIARCTTYPKADKPNKPLYRVSMKVPTIARLACMCDRTIQRSLPQLIKDGWVHVISHRANIYQFWIPCLVKAPRPGWFADNWDTDIEADGVTESRGSEAPGVTIDRDPTIERVTESRGSEAPGVTIDRDPTIERVTESRGSEAPGVTIDRDPTSDKKSPRLSVTPGVTIDRGKGDKKSPPSIQDLLSNPERGAGGNRQELLQQLYFLREHSADARKVKRLIFGADASDLESPDRIDIALFRERIKACKPIPTIGELHKMAEIIGYGTFFTWLDNVPVKVLCQRPTVNGKRDYFAEILHSIRKEAREPTYDPSRRNRKPRQPASAEKKTRSRPVRAVAGPSAGDGGLPQKVRKRGPSASSDPVLGQSAPPAGNALRQMVFPGCELPGPAPEGGS